MSSTEGFVERAQSQMPYRPAQHAAPWAVLTGGKSGMFLPRLLGCISWLMVSIGTFLVASGYLRVVDAEYLPSSALRTIGYGAAMYAVAAIFVALNRLTRRN